MAPDPVRVAIRQRLIGDQVLTAMLSTPSAIYHRQAPREALTPVVLLWRQAGTEQATFSGEAGETQLWLVKAVVRGPVADQAETIDDRIKARLHLADLVIAGKGAQEVSRESRVEFGEGDGAEMFHHVGGLYRVGVQPAT